MDVFVENLMKLYSRQLASRNAADELRFNEAVLNDNLSLDDQLSYRKEQLKRVSDDPEERKRIRGEIASLNDRVEQKKFADEYLEQLNNSASGISTVDAVVDWLNDRLASSSDETIKSAIRQQLVQKNAEKFTATKTLLDNQTKYAVNDKTDSVLDLQIGRVGAARTKALLAGNDELVSIYDLQLQSLTKAKFENSIEKDIKNFAASTVTGYASALNLLDAYNSKIAFAPQTGSVRIGDITYASPREFWTFKRDSYLADSGDSGFFSRYGSEKNLELKIKNSSNALNTSDVKRISVDYDSLLARPELANYQFKVSAAKQDTLQTGADFLSKAVINKYVGDLDVSAAVSKLNEIKSAGVNVEDAFAKILTAAAGTKQSQVENILSKAQEIMKADTAKTADQALNEALAAGAGVILSPAQLVTKTEKEITSEFAAGAGKGEFTPDTRTTAPGAVANVPPVVPAAKPQQPQPLAQPSPAVPLNKQLDFGAKDPAVRELQKFLNKQGFLVAQQGEGSPGLETDYFGPLTQAALKKFQAARGIVSSGDALTTGYGRLGPATLAKINELLK